MNKGLGKSHERWADRYGRLLSRYLRQPAGKVVSALEELGTGLFESGISPDRIVHIHGETLEFLRKKGPSREDGLSRALEALQIVFRGFAARLKIERERDLAAKTYIRGASCAETAPSAIPPDAVWTVNARGRVRFTSPRIEHVYGFSPAEIVTAGGKLYLPRIHREDRQRVRKARAAFFEERRAFNVEYRIRHKDGRWIWIHERSAHCYDHDGEQRADCILTDVTQGKLAEKALRESEQRFRQVFENSPIGIALIDLEHRFLKVNDALCEMLGHTQKEVLTKSPTDYLHPQDAARYAPRILRKKPPATPIECRFLRKDGETIWVRLTLANLHDERGRIRLILGMVENITQRKITETRLRQAHDELEQRVAKRTAELTAVNRKLHEHIQERRTIEQALRLSEEAYRLLFEHSVQGIALLIGGRLRAVNPAFCEIVRRKRELIIEIDPLDMVHPEDRPAQEEAMLQAEAGQPISTRVCRILRGDGSTAWVEASGKPTIWQGRDATQVILHDITERVLAEQALRRRETILTAISFAAERFLKHKDWGQSAPAVLERLGTAMGASRAHIFENHTNEAGRLLTTERYEWTAAGIEAQYDNPDRNEFDFGAAGFSEAVAQLTRGKTIQGLVREMAPGVCRVLSAQGIKSVLTSPIFVANHWWGFIGLDECCEERHWTQAEIECLRAAADTLGAAIQRQQAEIAIRKSEELFRTIIESSTDAIIAMDGEWHITIFNQAAEQMFGYKSKTVVGKPLDILMPEEFRSRHPRRNEEIAARKVAAGAPLEMRGCRKGGKTFPIEISISHSRVGDEPLILCIARDISLRKHAEESLRRQAMVFDNMYDGVIITDPTGRISGWNRGSERIFGYTEKEILNQSIDRLNPPEHTQRVTANIREIIEHEERWSGRVPFVRADGSTGVCEAAVVPLLDTDGNDLGRISVNRDITERIKAEEIIRNANERFALAADSAGIGVWDLDLARNELVWDDRMYGLYGIDKTDATITLETWRQLVHSDDRARATEEVEQAIRGEAEFDSEFRVVWPDGNVRYLKAFARIIRDEHGDAVRMTGINFDVTDLIHAEEEARRRREELARTSRLATVGELATGLAHEMNQPLAAILHFAQGCSRRLRGPTGAESEEILDVLDKISRQAERAATIVRHLYSFARKNDPRIVPTDLNDIVRQSLDFIAHELRIHAVETETRLLSVPPPVLADVTQITQVLLNLLRNGIEAMVTSEQHALLLETMPAGGDTLQCTVSDTGCGCDEHAFHRLFEAFFTTKANGLGMGLAISRSIIEAHGGRLWATRNLEKGMSFHFTLPIARNRGST